MIQAIRMAIKYSDVLPVAVELVEEIYESISDDGTISKKERSRLMKNTGRSFTRYRQHIINDGKTGITDSSCVAADQGYQRE